MLNTTEGVREGGRRSSVLRLFRDDAAADGAAYGGTDSSDYGGTGDGNRGGSGNGDGGGSAGTDIGDRSGPFGFDGSGFKLTRAASYNSEYSNIGIVRRCSSGQPLYGVEPWLFEPHALQCKCSD